MQIEYEGFCKRTEYHCNILSGVFQVSLFIFSIGKQWSKDLLDNKGMFTNQHTSIAKERVNVMIGKKHNDTHVIDH